MTLTTSFRPYILLAMLSKLDDLLTTVVNLRDLAKTTGSPDLIKIIEDLQAKLSSVRLEYADAVSRNADLVLENTRLRTELQNLTDAVTGKLVFAVTAYFHKETGEPYCPQCLDSDHVLSHLIPTAGNILTTTHKCPRCNNRYKLN
jgi:regulator of replication initiation timing